MIRKAQVIKEAKSLLILQIMLSSLLYPVTDILCLLSDMLRLFQTGLLGFLLQLNYFLNLVNLVILFLV